MRAQHAPGEHLSTCTGPDNCEEYLSLLSMTAAEKCAWITRDGARHARLRTASVGAPTFRVSHPRNEHLNFAPPDAYGADLARRRSAEATPASRFAEQHRAARLREFAAERMAMTARFAAAPPPRLSAAELAKYAPPKPYDRRSTT